MKDIVINFLYITHNNIHFSFFKKQSSKTNTLPSNTNHREYDTSNRFSSA